MGKRDNTSKAFLADNRRFADLCNYYLFKGEQIIKPENLTEQDTTEILDAVGSAEKVFGISDKSLSVQKWRDILKRAIIRYTDECIYVIIGIENQSEIHYAMPVRNMLYDAINYSRQAAESDKLHRTNKDYAERAEFLSGFKKTDSLTPVITLTVYWGDDVWDAPRSLHDMFKDNTLSLRRYISDYKLNLIAPSEITDFDKFRTSLGMVLEVIKYASDEAAMGRLLTQNHKFDHIEADAVRAINTFTKFKVSINNDEEEINMGNAWEDHRLSGKREGLCEGKREGTTLKLIDLTIKKFKKGCSVEQTADMLEESTENIRPIYDIISSMSGDYDAEKVYALLNKTSVSA